ncbi:MAG: Wadjet anti-phage system protein JetD domain-containing protein [Sedimenticola sp.]
MERPPWLDDETELLALLNGLLDKLDRKPAEEWKQLPAIRLTPGRFKKLFRNDEASDQSWLLLTALKQNGLIRIQPDPKRNSFDPLYQSARVALPPEAEETLREWLARPKKIPYRQQWRQAVEQYADRFPGDSDSLREWPLQIEGRSALELVERFTRIGEEGVAPLTLRQLGARCFWGLSKVLDNRMEQLQQLYPDLEPTPRRLLINLHLPSRIEGVLFIENLDSYLNLLENSPAYTEGLVFIYCAGFRGSAQRIRTQEAVSLHYQGDHNDEGRAALESWWFEKEAINHPCYFWGDLDYAGMSILKSLRQRFPELQAWQPGYQPMLEQLESGHSPEAAGKQQQIDPGKTGCAYADEVLLPAMRGSGLFVDQEVVVL